MKKDKSVFFMPIVILAGVLIITACDSGGVGVGEPYAPKIKEIYSENRELAVIWNVVNSAGSYNLYWNTTGNVSTSDNRIAGVLTPYFIHTGLSLFKTYYYVVTAVNAAGESAPSNEMSALPAVIPEELCKRFASDAEDSDLYGVSVALSGDYAVVGAFFEDGEGLNRGAAYVCARNQGGQDNWGEVAKLTASDAEDSDMFGYSVAISGDYAVVGAEYEDGAGFNRGAAYIYARNQGGQDNWGEVVKLTASDIEDFDKFGVSVAISGDYVIVGAIGEDGAGNARGAVYIF